LGIVESLTGDAEPTEFDGLVQFGGAFPLDMDSIVAAVVAFDSGRDEGAMAAGVTTNAFQLGNDRASATSPHPSGVKGEGWHFRKTDFVVIRESPASLGFRGKLRLDEDSDNNNDKD
jgi:hypothetical protein